ncbi:ThiF family adenylyltransferase, partial [bacterium]|nr:ThiF family adenylyltransferase [bacterium]
CDSLFDRNDLFYMMKLNRFSFTELHLFHKKICLIGCGGIGNNLIQQLLRIGIKDFLLVDDDVIELSNLSRQYLFSKKDVGSLKTDILKKAILAFNKDAKVEVINQKFQKDIYKKITNYNPDFVFVSADSPQTIVKETYLLFSSKQIPFMHVGYLNDLAIYGPIIDNKNLKYENYIFENKVIQDLNNDFVKNINKAYQAPSFGPINAFVSACAIIDFLQYIDDQKPLSYQKKIVVDIFNLKKEIIDFSDPVIGIYSSSSSLSSKFQQRISNCKERLQKQLHIKVVFGDLIFKDVNNYTTGTNIERANEFNSLVKECSILMPSIGG